MGYSGLALGNSLKMNWSVWAQFNFVLKETCPFWELENTLEIIDTKLKLSFSLFSRYVAGTAVQGSEVSYPRSQPCLLVAVINGGCVQCTCSSFLSDRPPAVLFTSQTWVCAFVRLRRWGWQSHVFSMWGSSSALRTEEKEWCHCGKDAQMTKAFQDAPVLLGFIPKHAQNSIPHPLAVNVCPELLLQNVWCLPHGVLKLYIFDCYSIVTALPQDRWFCCSWIN